MNGITYPDRARMILFTPGYGITFAREGSGLLKQLPTVHPVKISLVVGSAEVDREIRGMW